MLELNIKCVEYARRWLLSKGFVFHAVPFAAHVWKIKFLEQVTDKKVTAITTTDNESIVPPVSDSLLVWKVA